jgi:choline dehydrogenase-like flavoprotein
VDEGADGRAVTRARSYDVVIIGSGPTGGYAARALSAAGMAVLVLEAGRPRVWNEAWRRYDAWRRSLGYLIEEDPAAIRRQRIQSSCYAWPAHPHAFVDDLDNPYTTEPDRPFVWLRSRQVGGRMMVRGHGLQFYRFSDLDFKAGERDGASASWPISYADLAPYYDHVERWMRLRGTLNGLPQLPDAQLAGEIGLNPGERQLNAAISRQWRDRVVIPGRTAAAPLPILDALKTRRCAVRTNAVASRILVERDGGTVTGVAYRDRSNRREHEVRAKAVVLCCGSIESARLLLASATERHPDGLANSSGVVGRYLMDHTHLTGINADMHLANGDRRPERSWAYIPRFQNVCGRAEAFARGYGIQVFTEGDQCALTVFGEMLPRFDNRVTLDPDVRDAWGIPAARITCTYGENELAMEKRQAEACLEMLAAARFTVWRQKARFSAPGIANHEVGTARMGNDPRTSALNPFCQAWDVRNLFVMDGSCFVTQAVQNPTLTMLALAARSCDYLIERRRTGES